MRIFGDVIKETGTFNRTIIELKSIWGVIKLINRLAFNRTIIELKLMAKPFGRQNSPGTFNRTIIELKFSYFIPFRTFLPAFNRTIIELKFKQ